MKPLSQFDKRAVLTVTTKGTGGKDRIDVGGKFAEDLDEYEVPIVVHFTVIQKGDHGREKFARNFTQVDKPDAQAWTGYVEVDSGSFKKGAARGIAVAVLPYKDADAYGTLTWSSDIELEIGPEQSAS
jgi:hypothetical protein